MPANSVHLDFSANLARWMCARDVIAGEEALKAGGKKYLLRLDSQTDDEYNAYKSRACFFNATSRTLDGFLGLLFRRDPVVKLPDRDAGQAAGLRLFRDDVDLMGTTLFTYCKGIVNEVLAVGRCGSLVDWESSGDGRAYVARYLAEDITNWQTQRINGRNTVSLVCLREFVSQPDPEDPFELVQVEQYRVLKLVPAGVGETLGTSPNGEVAAGWKYVVEIWGKAGEKEKQDWMLLETRTPLRFGKPVPLIPFVFHGPRHSLPDVDKLPLADIIHVNLDHFRLDADYKHGLHWTALPTPWVAGFDKTADLKIGSTRAWVSDNIGAVAGFLEFKGHGLSTFENAQSRDQVLMALLGSRMLEDTKRVGETADAIELRQAGENSVLQSLAISVSDSITHVLRLVVWWNTLASVADDSVLLTINTDFTAKGLSSSELTSIVAAWQAGAISQATMFDLFRKGEVIPPGRTDEEEVKLLGAIGQSKVGGGSLQGGVTPGGGVNKETVLADGHPQHSTPNTQ